MVKKYNKTSDMHHIYVYFISFFLWLQLENKKQTFSMTYDVLSSTIIGGIYEIKDNILVAETDDKKDIYQFEILDKNTLKFIQNSSSVIKLTDETIGIPVSDGSIFKLQK